jgi:hypothetical protein
VPLHQQHVLEHPLGSHGPAAQRGGHPELNEPVVDLPIVAFGHDPRVLRVFLPTCTPEQLKQMFGPVDVFLAENELADSVSIFRLNGEELSSMQRRVAGG